MNKLEVAKHPAERFLIRVYGDSLSCPRISEGVAYSDTYPELVASAWRRVLTTTQVHLYNRSFSDATIQNIVKVYSSDSFYFGRPGGDVAILQCGVVDCAPRPIPGKLRALISRMPFGVKERIIRFLHNHRSFLLKSGLMWRVTPPDVFFEAMVRALKMMSPEFSRVYVINIAPTTAEIAIHSPGFPESITLYNSLIKNSIAAVAMTNITLIDIHSEISILPEGISRHISKLDGHHITNAGHRYFAKTIMEHERKFEVAGHYINGQAGVGKT